MPTEEKLSSATRAHHEFSPSKLQSLEACPGYKSEDTTSAASTDGTFLHDCTEEFLRSGVLNPGLDDKQAQIVQDCAAFVRQKMAEMGEGTILIVERRVAVDDEETTAGFLDICLYNPRTKQAKIFDWKFGLNAVEDAKNNVQGISYMLGIVREMNGEVDECEVIFVMPLQGREGLLDPHTFKSEQFQHLYLRIVTIVERAKLAKKDFDSGEITTTWKARGLNPTDSGCLFCARKAGCPALHKFALDVGRKYEPLGVPDVINPSLIGNPVQAGKALKFFAVMKALAEAYRTQATNKALTEENFMPEGYQIVQMVRRKIVDNKKFYQTLKETGFTEEEIMSAVEFTLGPVEKIVSNKAARGQKKAAVEEFGQLLSMNGATEESEPVSMLKLKKGDAATITT